MLINRAKFDQRIKKFQFTELFNDLGWDHVDNEQTITVNDQIFELNAVAQKRDFMIFVCSPQNSGKIPDATVRKKIDRSITKLFFEHLIIFINEEKAAQIWHLSVREPNKPIITRETTYYTNQRPELLYQRLRGLLFTIDEEENIGLVDVTQRISKSFNTNADKVTKQFYDKFKKEHGAFLEFIKGISDVVNKEWYASLMLNRLMFIYFIQKKGFLDNNKNYLQDKLKITQQKKGKNKFYSFYRDFLLVLFHKGLGSSARGEALLQEIGDVPYLNGGLFDIHPLEKRHENIQVDDDAFDRVFEFFDKFQWHLDTRITASGNDINPDVIGYIFEKYINDRASMGAYYTKEDITEYIGKNTIIPHLFDAAKKECANAFREESGLWKILQDNPDRYIYDAMRKGTELDLPAEIEAGIDTAKADLLERRKAWNKPAPSEYALPTEIWREVVERRKRYFEIKAKITNGTINDINDFITYNLDIRQFAQDAVQQYEGADFINAFYKAITAVTILDPTCGSGAFLFAALNILEPLYEACIQRMQEFVSEDDNKDGKRFSQFRKILDDTKRHPNLKYYIYKTIILNNLYGVDIMNEAVEIAKLRLFLKLVAEVDNSNDLEPLPDIDFNIRAGNTLVGFASYKKLQESAVIEMDFDNDAEKCREEAEKVGTAYSRFKDVQLIEDQSSADFRMAKHNLQERLSSLNEKLNVYLSKSYLQGRQMDKKKYAAWKLSHQPFHWFAEFYEIIHNRGGFDVIIGNPPYVEYSKIKKSYKLLDYITLECGNLHNFILEKCLGLKNQKGAIGLIVPLSLISTPRMNNAIELLKIQSNRSYISSFECRPGKLFVGADIRLCIVLVLPSRSDRNELYTTKLYKFPTLQREILFSILEYCNLMKINHHFNLIPKISSERELSIYNKLFGEKNKIISYVHENGTSKMLYYSYGFRYWAKVLTKPTFFEGQNASVSTGEKHLSLQEEVNKNLIGAVLSSSLFYWYYVVTSDAHNFTKHIIYGFPLDLFCAPSIEELFLQYQDDLEKNSKLKTVTYKTTGKITYREYYVKRSKGLIDKLDLLIGKHYAISNEEIDFILNYDIKFRLSDDLSSI